MINFYIKKIEEVISEKELPQAILSFGCERKEEILSKTNVNKQMESTAATILLQDLLLDSGFEKDEIIKDKKGRPHFKFQKDLYCSISHSGAYVSCAISDGPIGIDLQEMRPGKTDRISKRFFHEKEQELYARKQSLAIFYKIWTSKEGYLKMTGQGLPGSMKDFYLNLKEEALYMDKEMIASVVFESRDQMMFCLVKT